MIFSAKSIVVSNFRKLTLISLISLSFAIPFSISGSQLLTGSIINALLFIAAWKFDKKEYWPLIVLPSLAVLSRGIVFGPFTKFLIFFLPFIWLSNWVLILTMKYLDEKLNPLLAIFFSSFVKFTLLFLVAQIYFRFNLVPKLFLESMGFYQLITALMGGFAAWQIQKRFNGKLFS